LTVFIRADPVFQRLIDVFAGLLHMKQTVAASLSYPSPGREGGWPSLLESQIP
jgi:hypothetical protein